jgi:division protein CdvB (Snf7/Vps24/ESCRT-III family)
MKLHLEEKEVKAIMAVSKFACEVSGEKMPSGMELIKTIMNNNNKLCSIKPNFFTGDVDVEISSDYMVDGMNIYLKYGPILVAMFHSFTDIMEHMTTDLMDTIEKYNQPLEEKAGE